MRSEKKSAAQNLVAAAVARKLKTAIIKDAEWNFALCPHPKQTEACYLYEYSLECDSIIAEAKKLRERHVLSEANRKKFEKWFRLNPMPATQGIEPDTCCESAIAHCENYVMAGAWKGGELDRWCERALKANPDVIVTTKLSYDLHFLGTFAHFPTKHWLEIPAEEREQFATQLAPHRVQWGHEAFHMEKRPMCIESLKDFQNSPSRQSDHVFTARVPEHSGDFVVSWCWPRSDRKLLQDFKKWLEENRPPDQPPLHKTGQSPTRKTSHKDLLKALGALRLIRAFKNDFSEARYHAWEVLDKPLYKDQAAWIKAKNRAEREIETFQSTMFRT
jgi:hypothetical protein